MSDRPPAGASVGAASQAPPDGREEIPEYDLIGVGYGSKRRADPRLAAAIGDAPGDAETVLNVHLRF